MGTTSTDHGVQAYAWVTPATLIAIAVFAVLVIAAIIWGARLKAQRKAAEVELRDEAEAIVANTPVDDTAPTEVLVVPPPPVAPAPPPLAASETPATYEPAPVATPAPSASPSATGADDLTLLKGVGPKLAARLAELGVTRFAQVAALSSAEADALDAQLGTFRGRLTRDRWIDQAAYLAKDDRKGFEAEFGKL
ncbi:hypothetical protein M9980_12535 [Sphingomonas donggukensis]|uniref:Flap endonuclease-1-like 5' DNA nuclease n=1 Tax=Sphingomonas donggukensis TaxID=2949093 RepID=A0ABY4TXT3_9SPHN|nr:hypothetical protein [Sphingomonas donggukensis]URW75351.1 hypothetical protein M9980_12535 [Sphingomonas donggukensis]